MKSHIDNFIENARDVRRLLTIHTQVSGSKPGRRKNVEVLNKSCIVLLTACWESFIEELASAAFAAMLKRARGHETFPYSVLVLASTELKDSKDNRQVWQLAGDGWRQILKRYKKKLMVKYVEKFNTPSTTYVETLFDSLVGLSKISQYWSWSGMSTKRSANKLNSLVKLRGDIAHKVKAPAYVSKDVVKDYVDFVYRLAVKTHNELNEHIAKRTETRRPWSMYQFGKVG